MRLGGDASRDGCKEVFEDLGEDAASQAHRSSSSVKGPMVSVAAAPTGCDPQQDADAVASARCRRDGELRRPPRSWALPAGYRV